MGVFNQCQTRLLVHLIFLFNFLQESRWGSNMMESRRNRKVLQQDEKKSLKKWERLMEALSLSGPPDLLTNAWSFVLHSFTYQLFWQTCSKSFFLNGQSLCDVNSADFLRLCFWWWGWFTWLLDFTKFLQHIPDDLKSSKCHQLKGDQSPGDKMTVGTPRHVIGGWDCYWSPFNWDLAGMPWRS